MKTILRSSYLEKILKYRDVPAIKIISGARRVGKTYFLKQIIEYVANTMHADNILYINKENLEWEMIVDYKDLHTYVKKYFENSKGKRYIFIDEIQDIIGWEKCVRSLFSEECYDIYITGSNSNLLSGELASFLTGRYIEFPMYPLSFKEFLEFRESDDVKNEFMNYMRYGGLPAIHKMDFSDEIIYSYISGVFSTIVFRDIIGRYKIRNSLLLLDIMKFLSDNIGNTFSAKKISDYLKNQKIAISVDSLREYLGYFEKAFLVSKAQRYDIKGKNILEVHEKYYLHDLGLRSYLLGYHQEDVSQIIENIVYNELLKRGYSITIGKLGDLEIDFITEKDGVKKYFQVTYLLSHKEVVEREFRPLLKIDDNYEKTVLSLDEYYASEFKGINRINLIEWLMDS